VKLVIITQTRGKSGRALQAKRTVTTEMARIGRAASSEIFLGDARVALNQGLIVNRDGLVYVEGESGNQNITRKAVRSVRLKPGTSLEVGPYRLDVGTPAEGVDGVITIELVRPMDAPAADIRERAGKLTLASLHWPRRWVALALFAAVGVFAFALPAARVLHLPWQPGEGKVALVSDKAWNPGAVMLAHQPVESQCGRCHETAFVQVRDRACLECHKAIGHHVAPALQPAALFAGERCATCHRDHKGTRATHRDSDRLCVDCHRDLKQRSPQATAGNVADFARDHPPFRLSLPGEKKGEVRRVRQGGAPIRESTTLVFPHAPHLDPKGVKSPERGRVKLECADCHHPDSAAVGFVPVAMKRDCGQCHRLEFEPAVTTRQVPHGAPAEAQLLVEEFYASLALNGVKDSFQKAFGVEGEGLLRRVRQPSEAQRQGALALARAKAARVTEEMFEIRVCKTCHAVIRVEGDAGVAWTVAEVRAGNHWMPQARFDHKSHASAKCEKCHDVMTSKSSADVAMPAIAACRECHGGAEPQEKKLTSNCLMCHGFHVGEHPWPGSAAAGKVAAK
jgi:predicted CXXCH cytochrome family protein